MGKIRRLEVKLEAIDTEERTITVSVSQGHRPKTRELRLGGKYKELNEEEFRQLAIDLIGKYGGSCICLVLEDDEVVSILVPSEENRID